MSERDYWESQYKIGETPWDKGQPSPGLVDFLADQSDLPKGRVCIPGCGLGHDARAWAQYGFEATGMDIAPTAVSKASQIPFQGLGSCHFIDQDFLNPPHHPTPFEWVFEHTFYCAINPSMREAYHQSLLKWLAPGGHFLAVHYLIDEPDGPPFGTTPEEVLTRFNPSFELLAQWTPRSYPNRTGLERMFWWRRSS